MVLCIRTLAFPELDAIVVSKHEVLIQRKDYKYADAAVETRLCAIETVLCAVETCVQSEETELCWALHCTGHLVAIAVLAEAKDLKLET